MVVLDLRPSGVGTEALEAGFKLARRALTQPRKKLRNALAGVVEPAALAAAGLDPDARPGTLALEGWVRLGAVVGEGPGRG